MSTRFPPEEQLEMEDVIIVADNTDNEPLDTSLDDANMHGTTYQQTLRRSSCCTYFCFGFASSIFEAIWLSKNRMTEFMIEDMTLEEDEDEQMLTKFKE